MCERELSGGGAAVRGATKIVTDLRPAAVVLRRELIQDGRAAARGGEGGVGVASGVKVRALPAPSVTEPWLTATAAPPP